MVTVRAPLWLDSHTWTIDPDPYYRETDKYAPELVYSLEVQVTPAQAAEIAPHVGEMAAYVTNAVTIGDGPRRKMSITHAAKVTGVELTAELGIIHAEIIFTGHAKTARPIAFEDVPPPDDASTSGRTTLPGWPGVSFRQDGLFVHARVAGQAEGSVGQPWVTVSAGGDSESLKNTVSVAALGVTLDRAQCRTLARLLTHFWLYGDLPSPSNTK